MARKGGGAAAAAARAGTDDDIGFGMQRILMTDAGPAASGNRAGDCGQTPPRRKRLRVLTVN